MKLSSDRPVTRLGIFFFYDADGVVDDYVPVLLRGMMENLTHLTVVCNGKLTDEGKAKLAQFTDDIIVRANEGFDVWAYKTAIDAHGWDKLEQYDELVLFNMTIMGPVYPFSEMFDTMAERDLDFWGITKFHAVPFDPFGYSKDGMLHEHIQSHFMVYRRSLHTSKVFREYWDNMPPITSYLDSVGLHEAPFTQRFHDLGFKWDVYVDSNEFEGFTYGPITYAAEQLVERHRCPIFKRRSFFHDYDDMLNQSAGLASQDLYEYLRDHTDYDTDLIWQNALRTMNLADLTKDLHLDAIIDDSADSTDDSASSLERIGVVASIGGHGEPMELLRHLVNLPDGTDVHVVTRSTMPDDDLADIVDFAASAGLHIITHCDGTDDAFEAIESGRYDVMALVHDMNFPSPSLSNVGADAARMGLDNVLGSAGYVSRVLARFAQDGRLGVLMPPMPHHAEYFSRFAHTWGSQFAQVRDLLTSLSVHVPVTESKEAVAPATGMFWFRPAALSIGDGHTVLRQFFDLRQHEGDDFVLAPADLAVCYIAQGNGYYSTYAMTPRWASDMITGLSFETRQLAGAASDYRLTGTLRQSLDEVRSHRRKAAYLERLQTKIARIPGLSRVARRVLHLN